MPRQIFLLLLLLFSATAADARVFKWVDGNGMTHYSETAPEGQQAQAMPESPTPARGNSANTGRPDAMMWQLEEAEAARKKRSEAREKGIAEQEAALKKHRCTQAKAARYVLQQKNPVFSLDEKQNRVYMDDDTRAAEIKRLNEIVEANCE